MEINVIKEDRTKYNLLNPHPRETQKYSYRDMLDCWIAARENLVRWGVGDGDKPDFSNWIKEYHSSKMNKFLETEIQELIEKLPPPEKINIKEELNKVLFKKPTLSVGDMVDGRPNQHGYWIIRGESGYLEIVFAQLSNVGYLGNVVEPYLIIHTNSNLSNVKSWPIIVK